jgi:hypothetical protein
MHCIYDAWSHVKSSSIANCFRHAGTIKLPTARSVSPSSPIIIDAADTTAALQVNVDAPIIIDTANAADLDPSKDAAVEVEVQNLDDKINELANCGVIQNRMSIEFFLHESNLGTESLSPEEFIELQRAGCDTEEGAPEDPDEVVFIQEKHHKSEYLLRQPQYIGEASLMKPHTDEWVKVQKYAAEMTRVFRRHVQEQQKQTDL